MRRVLILSIIYGVVCLSASALGVLLSFAAQPGGITQANACLAPFLGPWSQTLPPNRHPVSTWSAEFALGAKCLGIMLAFSLLGSYVAPSRWLRDVSTVMAVLLLMVWVSMGLLKVISQLA